MSNVSRSDKRPNIIFIMTDDQRFDSFGFLSDQTVITPHLDQMAKEGVWFDRAYHVSPICMPSRASVHLSRYISDHNCSFEPPSCRTISYQEFMHSYPVQLRDAGYFTGFIGKFGYAVTEEKTDNAEFVLGKRLRKDGYKRQCGKEEDQSSMPKKYFDVWNGVTGQSRYLPEQDGSINGYPNPNKATHMTEHNAYQAEDFIRAAAKQNRPFNLNISFKAPHNPLTPMKKHLDQYKDKVIPRFYNDTPYHHGLLPEVVRFNSRNPEYYFNTGEWADWESGTWEVEENYQTDIKKYYALITGVDEAVGQIREMLKEMKLSDNTIIIYTSDNGMFCGSRQIHGKSILYEESVRAPMLVLDPRQDEERQGKRLEGMISHVDIAPTILDYAGVEQPENYRGTSFRPLVEGTCAKIRDHVFGENEFNNNLLPMQEVKDPSKYQSIRSKYVRDERYKYIFYYECHPTIEELFDLEEDPFEERNLVEDPDHHSVLEQMRALVHKYTNNQ